MRDRDAAQVSVPLPVPRTLRPDAEGLVGALPEDHAGCPVLTPPLRRAGEDGEGVMTGVICKASPTTDSDGTLRCQVTRVVCFSKTIEEGQWWAWLYGRRSTNEAKPWDNAAIPPWRRRRDVAYQGRRRSLQTGSIRRAAVQDFPRLPSVLKPS
ncbi:hypothetical protein CFE70_003407 [Pyrenophora teres f. teres 0-1]